MIFRMESEVQKKDKHIEEILGTKANMGNGGYGKLLTETTVYIISVDTHLTFVVNSKLKEADQVTGKRHCKEG
jgi:hypothetical protein